MQGDKVNLLLTPGDTSVDTAATAQWSISITGQELLDPSVPWGKVMNGFKYPGNLLEAAFNIKYLIDQAGANLNVTVNGADIIVQQTSPSYYAVDMSAIDNNTNWTPYPAGGGDPYNPYSNNPYPYAPVVSGPYGQVSITTGFDLGFAELTPAQIIVDSYIQFPILGVLVGIDGNNALIDASDIVKITTKDASVCIAGTTSTSAITGAGLKKCSPITLSGLAHADAMDVTDREEVLVAKMQVAPTTASTARKTDFLISACSMMASMTNPQPLRS